MSDTVILRACATVSEARICCGLLQTHNIHASVDNAEHVVQNWWVVPAVGGVHVRVPRSQLDAAHTVLNEHVQHAGALLRQHASPGDPITKTRRWKALSMLLLWLSLWLGIAHLLFYGFFTWLDGLVPYSWIPNPEPPQTEVSIGNGMGVGPAGPGAEGVVLVFVIAMILIWELISSRPEKPKKDPQI